MDRMHPHNIPLPDSPIQGYVDIQEDVGQQMPIKSLELDVSILFTSSNYDLVAQDETPSLIYSTQSSLSQSQDPKQTGPASDPVADSGIHVDQGAVQPCEAPLADAQEHEMITGPKFVHAFTGA
jgi:hypothetical protein